MDAATFFALFAKLMKENPPHNDYPILARMKRIGIEPGKSFSLAAASPEVQEALRAALPQALTQIKMAFYRAGTLADGWRTNTTAIGTYGTDYLHRAGIAYAALGANTIEDAVYPTAFADADGEPVSSDRRYTKEGMMFTDYYAEQSCTAGRSSFITGQATLRTGLFSKVGVPGATVGLQAEDATIAELLKPLGYATGQFGKNHLGDRNEFLPTVHGFDEFVGNLYHLNAEEEPEQWTYPLDPAFREAFRPRDAMGFKSMSLKKLLDFFDKDMLRHFKFERFSFDHVIPRDRQAL